MAMHFIDHMCAEFTVDIIIMSCKEACDALQEETTEAAAAGRQMCKQSHSRQAVLCQSVSERGSAYPSGRTISLQSWLMH